MYNGIGLTTPRGSGTSGHVVKNASSLRPGQRDGTARRNYYDRERTPKAKPLDKGIVDHERKRQVEVKCLELQDELEERGLEESEIETRVDELRDRLLRNLERLDVTEAKRIKPFETQLIAEAKAKENQRMARALRVGEDYAEGAAFDRELQELRRQKRMLEKELDRAVDDERRAEREREDRRRRRGGRKRSRSRSPRSRSSRSRSRSISDADSHRSPRRSRQRYSRGRRSHSPSSDREPRYRRRHSPAQPDNGIDSTDSQVRAVEDGEPGEIEDVDPAPIQGQGTATEEPTGKEDSD
ncbi:RNA-splicing factor [Coemansia sp. RSA 2708]|nr:RNA-splicing factor [Coemansia sp. RSA 2708]